MLDGPRLAPASGGPPRSLAVLLHGYGSNGDDLIGLAAMIQPLLPDTAFVAPHAPSRMAGLADGRQWWPIQTFSMAERIVGADAAAPDIDAFLTAELAAAKFDDDRLLLVQTVWKRVGYAMMRRQFGGSNGSLHHRCGS